MPELGSAAEPPPEAGTLAYAGLPRRFLAWLIDNLITFSTSTILSGVLVRGLMLAGVWAPRYGDAAAGWEAVDPVGRGAVIVAFFLCQGPIYYAVCESSGWQATPGKWLVGLHVACVDGERIGWRRSLGRWCVIMLAQFLVLWLVSVITILATARRQALHDLVARTATPLGRPPAAGRLEAWKVAAALVAPAVFAAAVFLATL